MPQHVVIELTDEEYLEVQDIVKDNGVSFQEILMSGADSYRNDYSFPITD